METVLRGTLIAIVIVFLFLSFPTIMKFVLLGIGIITFAILVYSSILIIFDWA